MDVISEIKDHFNQGYFDRAMDIRSLPEGYPAWTIKTKTYVGVFVPAEECPDFSEHFASAWIHTEDHVQVGEKEYRRVLMLTSEDMELRNEFATVCSQFIQPGINGTERELLVTDPEQWWKHWMTLVGNRISIKNVVPVLGELETLLYYQRERKKPAWSGVENGTHDIEMETESCEVKSTAERYGYQVSISSHHQLKPGDKKLGLMFCRYEPSSYGKNIDGIVSELVKAGYDSITLEKKLRDIGFDKGCTARKERYSLLEMVYYPVDAEFPIVTEKSFKGDHLPKGIIKFQYTVDLSSLTGENLIK